MFLGRHHSSSSLAFALLFAGLLPPSAVIAATQGSGISVLTYGADPTGSTDSTAALQAAADAADAANTTLYVPDGLYRISSPIEIQSSVQLDASATVRATKPMPAVFRVGSSAVVAQTSFRGGIIDAANQAQDGIFFRQYAHIRVADVLVKNASANGFHFGDPSFAANSYEAVASGLSTVRDNGLFPDGWIDRPVYRINRSGRKLFAIRFRGLGLRCARVHRWQFLHRCSRLVACQRWLDDCRFR